MPLCIFKHFLAKLIQLITIHISLTWIFECVQLSLKGNVWYVTNVLRIEKHLL